MAIISRMLTVTVCVVSVAAWSILQAANSAARETPSQPDQGISLIIHNSQITTLDADHPSATAVAIRHGRFVKVGTDEEILAIRGEATHVIDAHGRRMIPGLNDSHSHYIRGGLAFNAILRWDGVPTLAEGLEMIRQQALRTPKGHWIRVIGGWTPHQFLEKRLPTPEELTRAAPHTPGKEYADFQKWVKMVPPNTNTDPLREDGYVIEGGGEYLVWDAADFENFMSPRPELKPAMAQNLEKVVTLLVENRWPFRVHATYDESISKILDVLEQVNKHTPFRGLRWSVEHAETLKEPSIDRILALGGGVAIQDRMVFLGDDFLNRYGAEAASHTPPLRILLDKGVPVGMGTDGTRGSSFNPWVGLHWLVTGETAGGTRLYGPDNLLTREEALRLYTVGSAWFSLKYFGSYWKKESQ